MGLRGKRWREGGVETREWKEWEGEGEGRGNARNRAEEGRVKVGSHAVIIYFKRH